MSSITSPLRAVAPVRNAATKREEEQNETEKEKKDFTIFPAEDPFVVAPDTPTKREGGRAVHGGGEKVEQALRPRPLRIHRKHVTGTGTAGAPHGFSPTRKPARQEAQILTLFPRADQASSPASVNTTFSTPGRDEMERKKGNLNEFSAIDGPFGRVKDVKELEESRKRLKEGSRTGKAAKKRDNGETGCGCLVM